MLIYRVCENEWEFDGAPTPQKLPVVPNCTIYSSSQQAKHRYPHSSQNYERILPLIVVGSGAGLSSSDTISYRQRLREFTENAATSLVTMETQNNLL